MAITTEEIQHVARLARLEMSAAAAEKFASQIDDILGYVDTLNGVTTDDVAPTSHVLSLVNALREDVPPEASSAADPLANAPESSEGMFEVPKVIE
jgi:aspartyl-tRNA(Asn)/glutamyl-tRNA(Gln) amidotransferase subunit C